MKNTEVTIEVVTATGSTRIIECGATNIMGFPTGEPEAVVIARALARAINIYGPELLAAFDKAMAGYQTYAAALATLTEVATTAPSPGPVRCGTPDTTFPDSRCHLDKDPADPSHALTAVCGRWSGCPRTVKEHDNG